MSSKSDRVYQLCSKNVVTAQKTSKMEDTVKIMRAHDFRRLPITENDQICGIITSTDVLNGIATFEKGATRVKTFMDSSIEEKMSYPVVTVDIHTTIEEAVKIMIENNIGDVPVLDEESRLIGILTERDILQIFEFKDATIKVEDLAFPLVKTNPDDSIGNAAKLMTESGRRNIIITKPEEGKVEGILTSMDLIRFIGKEETMNLIKTGKEEKALELLVKLIMTRGVLTMKTGTPAHTAAKMMRQWNIGTLPITEDDKPISIINERSLLKLFL